MAILTDKSPMPWGKYKDKAMVEVPATYLLWLYRQKTKLDNDVLAYIIDNMQVLEEEEKKTMNTSYKNRRDN